MSKVRKVTSDSSNESQLDQRQKRTTQSDIHIVLSPTPCADLPARLAKIYALAISRYQQHSGQEREHH